MTGRLGARTVFPEDADTVEEVRHATDGKGVEVAVDAVGVSVTRDQCVRSVSSGGRVIFTGLHEADSVLPINTMIRSEITCIGSFAYSSLNFKTALRWLAEGRMGLEGGIIECPLAKGAHWFERLLANPEKVAKVLLYPHAPSKEIYRCST